MLICFVEYIYFDGIKSLSIKSGYSKIEEVSVLDAYRLRNMSLFNFDLSNFHSYRVHHAILQRLGFSLVRRATETPMKLLTDMSQYYQHN
jgi:hypothetical protein